MNNKEQILRHLNCVNDELNRAIGLLDPDNNQFEQVLLRVSLKRLEDIKELLENEH